MEEARITREDLERIAEMVTWQLDEIGGTDREMAYPAMLRTIAAGMLHDDYIVSDGEVSGYTHG